MARVRRGGYNAGRIPAGGATRGRPSPKHPRLMATLGASGGGASGGGPGGAATIGVAVVGVGDGWPGQRDALLSLAGRVRVAAVVDAVPLRAEGAAAEVGAVAAGGVLAAARRPDVRAVLLGDPAWWGLSALDLLLTAEKPVLVCGPVDPADDRLDALAARAAATGAVVVPDLSRRFTPSTLRLRELAATTLGAVGRVEVTAPLPAPSPLADSYGQPVNAARFVSLADWAAHLLPGPVREVSAAADPAAGPATVTLTADGAEAVVTLAPGEDGPAEATVTCAGGTATLAGGRTLRVAVRGEAERTEDLSAEPPGFRTLLTLFLRRAVGGLVPVPDLHDLAAAVTLGRAAAESARTGRPVPLSVPGGQADRPR